MKSFRADTLNEKTVIRLTSIVMYQKSLQNTFWMSLLFTKSLSTKSIRPAKRHHKPQFERTVSCWLKLLAVVFDYAAHAKLITIFGNQVELILWSKFCSAMISILKVPDARDSITTVDKIWLRNIVHIKSYLSLTVPHYWQSKKDNCEWWQEFTKVGSPTLIPWASCCSVIQ